MNIKSSLVITVCSIALVIPTNTRAETSGEVACEHLAPPLFELVKALVVIPGAFEDLYAGFTKEEKEKFDDVREKGLELADVAKAYRMAFIEACFVD